ETVGALITHQGQLVQRGLGSGGRAFGQLVLDRFQQFLVGESLVGFVIGLGHAWSRWCSVPGGTGLRGSSSWCSRFKASPGRPGGCVTPTAAHAAGSASRRSP